MLGNLNILPSHKLDSLKKYVQNGLATGSDLSDFKSFLVAGARNLALAEQNNTDIVTPCKCCFGSLKFVEYYLKQREPIRDQINALLRPEGLQWEVRADVRHLLTVLHHDVEIETLRAAVVNPLE